MEQAVLRGKIGLGRAVVASLIVICVFLMLPLAAAQVQTIDVSTSNSTYSVGEHVTILWDKSNTCLQTSDATGALQFSPPYPMSIFKHTLTDLKSGSYTSDFSFGKDGVGPWLVLLQIAGTNCQATGQASWNVTATPIPEFPSSTLATTLTMTIALAACALLLTQRRRPRTTRF